MTKKTNGQGQVSAECQCTEAYSTLMENKNNNEEKNKTKTTTTPCAGDKTNLIATVGQDNNSVAIKMRNYRKTIKR